MLIPSLHSQRGFTIVELLIVIVIIGILALITIVAYNGITDRARTSAVQNDLAAFAKKVRVFEADNTRFPITTAELGTLLFKVSSGSYDTSGNNFLYCKSATGDAYAAVAWVKNGKKYSVDSASGGVKEYTGSYSSQTVICPVFSLPSTGNFWGYGASTWQSWTQ